MNSKSIIKYITLGSIAALLVLAFLLPVVSKKNAREETERTSLIDESFDKIESEAVLSQENAVRTFINQPPASPNPGENRTTFRIIEVIPHDACSIFPFLVEWGNDPSTKRPIKEEYDKWVPIGYEGLMALSSTGGGSWTMFGDDTFYSQSAPIVKDTLPDYNVPMGNLQKAGVWYRLTDSAEKFAVDKKNGVKYSGYFEYVGAGKGLYYIAPTYAAEKSDGENEIKGLRYKLQAIPRKGSEKAKGELYVKSPAYYRAKEHIGDAYVAGAVCNTENNYDLSFEKAQMGEYRVDFKKLAFAEAGGTGFDYILSVEDPDTWIKGFRFFKGGNYAVKKAVAKPGSGKYVRVEHTVYTDNYKDDSLTLGNGYFRLYESNDTAPRYDVTFEEVTYGKGNYCANAPTAAEWEETGTPGDPNYLALQKCFFVYQGEGKGTYKLLFRYAGAPKTGETFVRYTEELIRVTYKDENGEGAYHLTATEKDNTTKPGEESKPIYADPKIDLNTSGEPLDYANAITKIDHYNIVCAGTDNTQYGGRGVMQGAQGDSYGVEKGGWVFHEEKVLSKSDLTLLSKIHKNYEGQNSNQNGYIPIGTKIYVRSQELRLRHYYRNTFINNEWFKLLCYAVHPKDATQSYGVMIDGVGYDHSKSGADNLVAAQDILKAFNDKYRIEVVQITLDQLTPEKVKSADLLYIAKTPAINGLRTKWSEISKAREDYGEEPLVPWPWPDADTYPLSAVGDIDIRTLMTIYDECITKKSVALMLDGSFDGSASGDNRIEKNITKLYYLMNFFVEAQNFQYFMPDMYPSIAKEEYTKIHGNTDTTDGGVATLDAYKTIWSDVPDWTTSDLYNIVFVDNERTEKNVSAWNTSDIMGHFKVFYTKENIGTTKKETPFPFRYNMTEAWGHVADGETKLTLGMWMVDYFFSANKNGNIWKILNNRDIDDYQIVVEPLNAEVVASADGSIRRRVIFADEMDLKSFEIAYKVFAMGTIKTSVELETITVTLDGNGVGYVSPYVPPTLGLGDINVVNVREGFELSASTETPKALNPEIDSKTVTITATDKKGHTGTAEIEVIVREAFDLN